MIVFLASMQAVTRSAIFLNRSTRGRQEVTLPLTISDRIFKNEIVTLVVSSYHEPGYDDPDMTKMQQVTKKNLLQTCMFYYYLLFDLKPSAPSPEFWDESVRLNFISSFRGKNELL